MLDINLADWIAGGAAAAGAAGTIVKLIFNSRWYKRRTSLRKDKMALIESKERAERSADDARKYAEASAKAAYQWHNTAQALDRRVSVLEESDRSNSSLITQLRAELEDLWRRFRTALHFIIDQQDYVASLRRMFSDKLPDHTLPDPPAIPATVQD